MFTVNQQLLEKAQRCLSDHRVIYWIIGGSCTGKSTVSRAITQHSELALYDMDRHIYDRYMQRYTDERHPANKTWLSAPNPLAWQLSLPLEAFDAYNRAASAEYLDLFTDDPEIIESQHPLVVDGGITHPSLLVKIVPPEQIVCINASRAMRIHEWETSEARALMKKWIYDLPEPDVKWKKFLDCDEAINQTIVTECQTHNIQIFLRDAEASVSAMSQEIADYLGIELLPFT